MDFDDPPGDPVQQLRRWLAEAEQIGLPNPNAMTLATVGPSGSPSVRIVLLKGLDDDGVVFFTNRRSRKGLAIAASPQVALLFHWDPLGRQVEIEGRASIASDEVSDGYFATRPRASQLAAWASRQSEPIASRALLDAAYAEVESRFAGVEVPRPPHWGGYRVSLETIVFWQAHPFRLHDRVRYRRGGEGGWVAQRLCP